MMCVATKRIVWYLNEYGCMSGRDICYDLGIDETDVDAAYYDGIVKKVDGPLNAGSRPWYDVCKAFKTNKKGNK